MSALPNILLLGASGLIDRFVTDDLRGRGFTVIGVARKYAASQRLGASDMELPILAFVSGALVKTGPAIVLMLVALLTLDNR